MSEDIPSLQAVIFDLDGTLINSPDVYYRLLQETFDRLGLSPVSRSAIFRAASDGDFDWDQILPPQRKEETIEKIRSAARKIYPLFFPKELRIIEGAAHTLKTIAGAGLKIGLASSTPLNQIKDKLLPLRQSGVEGLIEAIITPDHVSAKKPDPEPLLACAGSLGVLAEKSVYVGDTTADIRAGKSAGMKTVAVLTGFGNYDTLIKEGPDLILESVAGLLSEVR
jgi:phosphoglycolate phosphatase-like HAD superfamily hydrolase